MHQVRTFQEGNVSLQKNTIKDSKILVKTITYFFVLCIILVIAFFFSFQAIILPKYKLQILNEAELSCNMLEEIIDNTIVSKMNDTSFEIVLSNKSSIAMLAQQPDISAQQALAPLALLDEKIKNTHLFYTIDIYFEQSNTMLSSLYGLKNFDNYPVERKKYFNWLDNTNNSQDYVNNLDIHRYSVKLWDKSINIVSFSKTFLFHINGLTYKVIINYGMKRDELAALLKIDTQSPNEKYILTNRNSSYADISHKSFGEDAMKEAAEKLENLKSAESFKLEDNLYIASMSSKQLYGYQIVKLIPITDIESASKDIRKIFVLFLAGILVISLSLSYMASLKLYNPFRKLLQKVDFLELALEENRQGALNHFFLSLLHGTVHDPAEIERKLKLLNVSFPYGQFVVIRLMFSERIVKHIGLEPFQHILQFIMDKLLRFNDERCVHFVVEANEMSLELILNYSQDEAYEDFLQFLLALYELDELLPSTMRISSGLVRTCPDELALSFETASEAYRYQFIYPEEKHLSYEALDIGRRKTCFEPELLHEFRDCARKLDIEGLYREMGNIAARIETGGYTVQCSLRVLEDLAEEFVACLNTCYAHSSVGRKEQLNGKAGDPLNINEAMLPIQSLYTDWLLYRESMNDNKKSTLILGAIEYINSNLDRPLTLDEVSQHIFISPAYLSKIFKEISGTNFNTYVNNSRMEKARDLLLNGNSSVEDIAIHLGFTGSNYFIKRFKQFYGTTPSVYRANSLKR